MPSHTYHPLILQREAMSKDTEVAAKALMNSHREKPCLILSAIITNDGETEIASNRLIFSTKNGFETGPLHQFRAELDDTLLANLLFEITMDPYLREHIPDLQWHMPFCQMPGSAEFDFDMGYIEILLMPGVVRIAYPDPNGMGKNLATRVLADSIADDQPGFLNLGVYAAGISSSAHEAMELQAKVESLRPIWGNLQRDFNEFMQKNINSIELGTPRLLKKE
jgi:hypothetical protein